MQEKTWEYEKWVGSQAAFSPSRYVKQLASTASSRPHYCRVQSFGRIWKIWKRIWACIRSIYPNKIRGVRPRSLTAKTTDDFKTQLKGWICIAYYARTSNHLTIIKIDRYIFIYLFCCLNPSIFCLFYWKSKYIYNSKICSSIWYFSSRFVLKTIEYMFSLLRLFY